MESWNLKDKISQLISNFFKTIKIIIKYLLDVLKLFVLFLVIGIPIDLAGEKIELTRKFITHITYFLLFTGVVWIIYKLIDKKYPDEKETKIENKSFLEKYWWDL